MTIHYNKAYKRMKVEIQALNSEIDGGKQSPSRPGLLHYRGESLW